MKFLLDSHSFVWAICLPEQLSAAALASIESGDNEVFVSVASVWELAIKQDRRKLDLPLPVTEVLARAEFELLPISVSHALAAGSLPGIHRDPFDRMLVAQARAEGLTLVTRDPLLPRYGVACLLA